MTPRTGPGAGSPGSSAISARAVWQGAAIAALILVLATGLFLVVWLVAYPLALLFAAIVLANALAPAVRLFERFLPPLGATATTYLLFVLSIVAVGWLVVPGLLAQARELASVAPTLLGQLRGWLDHVVPGLAQRATEAVEPILAEAGAEILRVPLALMAFVAGAALVLVMAVHWSIGSDDLRRYAFSLVPRHLRDEAAEITAEVVDTIGGYLRARIVVALLVGAVIFAGLSLLGVEYPLVLAVLAAVGELIPYLGPTVAAAPALAFALLASPWQAGAVLVLYIAAQQAKTFVLMPTMVRQYVNLPPLLVILALIAGTSVGGVIGAIVAPPLVGALRVIVLRVVTPPIRRWAEASKLGAGDDGPDASAAPETERPATRLAVSGRHAGDDDA